ncbi:MAG: diaminopimelate epimerase [Caenispirillum bisanense]|nr:diaminopimelate epimerase [Caenispirillum bisanense]MCA1974578.1 diaminopimelate epimerase [Caenispirillum sp.]
MSTTSTTPLRFLKMHGLGNDFVIVDRRADARPLPAAAIAAVGNRRTGVGCDQFITIEPGDGEADAVMGIYNGDDGSPAGACGNATRCVAHLLMQETGKAEVAIRTVSGLLRGWRDAATGLVTVDMGPARLDWQEIPLAEARDTLHAGLSVGPLHDPVCVSMGNPHAVFFIDDVAAVDLPAVGPQVERHPLFPARTNVEIVQVLDRGRVRMRVWERAAGITMACGSGACAVGVAAVRRGLTDRRVEVMLDGGPLTIEWREADGHVLMTGPVATAFAGSVDPSLLPAPAPAFT